MSVKKRHSKKLRRDVWGYDAEIGGVRKRRFGFSSKGAAELALANARVAANERAAGVRIDPQPSAAVTVRELVERRARAVRRVTARRVLREWLATLAPGLKVVELKSAHLQAYAEARLKDVRAQTVAREITDVCACLNGARDLFPSLDEWQPPRRPRLQVPTGSRDRIITADEATRILARLRRPREIGETESHFSVRLDAADLLQIALLTAARRSEILALRWHDVNFERGEVQITSTKTGGKVRSVPMSLALVALLKRRKIAAGASARVFPALTHATMLSNHTNLHYAEASRACSILYGRETPGGWVLHDARHTAITAMLHAGNSLESVMAISGHAARVMTMRYAHATEATRRKAIAALDQFAA